MLCFPGVQCCGNIRPTFHWVSVSTNWPPHACSCLHSVVSNGEPRAPFDYASFLRAHEAQSAIYTDGLTVRLLEPPIEYKILNQCMCLTDTMLGLIWWHSSRKYTAPLIQLMRHRGKETISTRNPVHFNTAEPTSGVCDIRALTWKWQGFRGHWRTSTALSLQGLETYVLKRLWADRVGPQQQQHLGSQTVCDNFEPVSLFDLLSYLKPRAVHCFLRTPTTSWRVIVICELYWKYLWRTPCNSVSDWTQKRRYKVAGGSKTKKRTGCSIRDGYSVYYLSVSWRDRNLSGSDLFLDQNFSLW